MTSQKYLAHEKSKKDILKWVPFVKLLKVEEALNIEFEKQLELKGKEDKNVIQLHYKHLYLAITMYSSGPESRAWSTTPPQLTLPLIQNW